MKLKITSVILAILITFSQSYAGDKYRMDVNQKMQDAESVVSLAPYNILPDPDLFLISLAQGFTVDSITIGPEILTQLEGFDDYKTNGEVNHFIQVDPSTPDNLQAVDVQTDSLDPTGATSRRSKYAISSDGGLTWSYVIDVPDGRRSGFPVLQLRNGAAIIANHNIHPSTTGLDVMLYVDVAPLAGSFTEYQFSTHAPFGIWPQIAVMTNNNVALLSRRNVSGNGPETLYVALWNGASWGPRSIFYLQADNYVATVGSNMQFQIAAASNTATVTGVAHPVLANDTLFASRMYARTSTDNGVTWSPVTVVFSPYMQGNDTIIAAGGLDLKYKPNSNTWFLSYIESKAFEGSALFANAVLKIRRSDGNVFTLTNAATVGATTTYNQTMSFVFSIDNPSIGFSRDGRMMYCVYTVVKPDTSRGYNQRDLYFQYSFNDGANWSIPIRLTNTVSIDEAYPSVSNWNKGNVNANETYELNFVYMKDPGVGPTTFGGSAPASRNNTIYRKITFGPPIGINNNSSTVKEFALAQNYPNPFNPSTVIKFAMPKASNVTLKVYDVIGREVSTLLNNAPYKPGEYEVNFTPSELSSGIYFYTINTGEFTQTRKMMFIK